MTMSDRDFEFYKTMLYEKSGLSLSREKTYLLESRLGLLAQRRKYATLCAMTQSLITKQDNGLIREVIDAMTTNETLFFRDDRPFKHFQNILIPDLIKARQNTRSLRIWSAACSTGQEPFSIAISLLEKIPDIDKWRVEIVATDISDNSLDQARRAEYTQFEVQRGLPIHMAMKYFQQAGNLWKLNDKVRTMVRFEHFNLLDPMQGLGKFDVIFCRNVLIYFDEATKKQILDRAIRQLSPDGCLMLGGAETAFGFCKGIKFDTTCPGLYRLNSHADAPVCTVAS